MTAKKINPQKRGRKPPLFKGNRVSSGVGTKLLRKEVKKRDQHRCQFPSCNNTRYLQVFFLQHFDNKELKFRSENAITLCNECIKKCTKDDSYFMLLKAIIKGSEHMVQQQYIENRLKELNRLDE